MVRREGVGVGGVGGWGTCSLMSAGMYVGVVILLTLA